MKSLEHAYIWILKLPPTSKPNCDTIQASWKGTFNNQMRAMRLNTVSNDKLSLNYNLIWQWKSLFIKKTLFESGLLLPSYQKQSHLGLLSLTRPVCTSTLVYYILTTTFILRDQPISFDNSDLCRSDFRTLHPDTTTLAWHWLIIQQFTRK